MPITYTVTLELDNVAKTGIVRDTTPYATLGINPATYGVKGLGTVVGPDGTAIVSFLTSGAPLIDIAAGATTSTAFNLPLGTDGEILNGEYTLEYDVRYAASGLPIFSIAAAGNIMTTVGQDELSQVLEAGDSFTISAGPNAGVKTVVSATDVGSNLEIVTSQTLVNEGPVGGTWLFDVTRDALSASYLFNGCNIVTPTVSVVSTCTGTQFGTLVYSDTTVLPSTHVLDSRAWSVAYPQNLNPAPSVDPVTASTQNVNFTASATGQWNYRLTQNVTVTQTDGLIYTYTETTGAQPYTVVCSGNLCSVMECYESLLAKQQQDITSSGSSALTLTILLLNSYAVLSQSQQACGDYTAMAATIAKMEALIDASGECTCDCDGTEGNQWINNAGYESQTLIEEIAASIQYKLFNGVPSTGQDSTLGVAVGAVWQNTNTQIEYICTSNAVGAATWEVYYDPTTTASAYSIKSGVPTVTDDSSLGYLVGYVIQNSLTGIEYTCKDNTIGAAVWKLSKPICIDLLFSQLGVGAPDLIVNQNPTTATITSAYNNVGDYNVVASSAIFTEDFTHVIFGPTYDGIGIFGCTWINATTLNVFTRVASTGASQNGLAASGAAMKIEIFG